MANLGALYGLLHRPGEGARVLPDSLDAKPKFSTYGRPWIVMPTAMPGMSYCVIQGAMVASMPGVVIWQILEQNPYIF